MQTRAKIGLVLLLVISVMAVLGVAIARHGFSARGKPTRIEQFLASHARRRATPSGGRDLRNCFLLTRERVAVPAA